jgi:hypothetical protein
MDTSVCPYLGLEDDPETRLAFPANRNCCFRLRVLNSIDLNHQTRYCLNHHYHNCPVYKKGDRQLASTSLPAEPGTSRRSHRRIITIFSAALLVILISSFACSGKIFNGLWTGNIAAAIPDFEDLPSQTPEPSPTATGAPDLSGFIQAATVMLKNLGVPPTQIAFDEF